MKYAEITDVKDFSESLISNYVLYNNYPNPFNPNTSIEYAIPSNGFVSLIVYNMLGREISKLVNEQKSAGKYKVDFNAENLSSGIYFYKIKSGSFNQVKKMLLLK